MCELVFDVVGELLGASPHVALFVPENLQPAPEAQHERITPDIKLPILVEHGLNVLLHQGRFSLP